MGGIFQIGYSATRQRYRAAQHSSDEGFRAVDVVGLHVLPSPTMIRPSDLELGRLRRHMHANFSTCGFARR